MPRPGRALPATTGASHHAARPAGPATRLATRLAPPPPCPWLRVHAHPPCPMGPRASRTLILYARLMPDAKKPPNGATREANVPSASPRRWAASAARASTESPPAPQASTLTGRKGGGVSQSGAAKSDCGRAGMKRGVLRAVAFLQRVERPVPWSRCDGRSQGAAAKGLTAARFTAARFLHSCVVPSSSTWP
eukprot:scaffold5790_cov101-Isochrysis_galbana.AAC.7